MSHNTWVHRTVRPLVRPLTRTAVQPNHLTYLRLITGLAAAVALAHGDELWRLVGTGIFVLAFLLDRADGELARLSGRTSEAGHKLDLVCDAHCNALTFVGIGIGLRASELGSLAIGMGTLAGLAVAAILFMVLRTEASAGARAAESRSAAGFDADDGMLAVPLFVWFEQEEPLLMLAAVGAPLYFAFMAVNLRRRRVRRAGPRAAAAVHRQLDGSVAR